MNLSTDIYYKRTEDLLLQVPIPMSTGFGSRLTNVGNVENKGLEVALNTLNSDGEFKWTSDFTFSINRNKVLNIELPNNQCLKMLVNFRKVSKSKFLLWFLP